jgi:hypothetical protein
MAYPFLIQGSNIVVVIGNKSHTVSKTHVTYQKVLDAIKAGDWDTVKDIIEPKKVVLNYGNGNVSIQGETLFWKGKELHSAMSVRMIQMLQEGFPIEPMVNFMDNLYQNPSKRSVDELYGFLEKSQLPITPDGCFLAYKKVRDNYMDCHTGTMDNSVGKIVEMQRNEVDDNKDRTCSSGLHFCSLGYLSHFGGERIMIVKINPRDVVSIPSDYNDTKGRACRYEVIGELNKEEAPEDAFTAPVQSNGNTIVKKEPKVGSSAFYCGYADARADRQPTARGDDGQQYSGREYSDYHEGYHKGSLDAAMGLAVRYIYAPKARAAWTPVWGRGEH